MLSRAFSQLARECGRSRCMCLEKLREAGSNPDTVEVARKHFEKCKLLSPWSTDIMYEASESDSSDSIGGDVRADVGEDGAP